MNAPGFFPSSRRHTLVQDAWAVVVVFAIAGAIGAIAVWRGRSVRVVHPTISLAEMQAFVAGDEALILDARTPREYAAGHIPKAVNLPVSAWATRDRVFRSHGVRRPRERLAIVYCGGRWCGQAEELQGALVNDGHRMVGLFPGGVEDWRAAGLPLAASRPASP